MDERDAFRAFATSEDATQSQRHIKPIHWYVACRLVVEGGFLPEEVTPRPPLVARERDGWRLSYDPAVATGGERTILGGLKTKDVDVTVLKPGLGPVLAVSCKGAVKAFRNLTNRLEEAVGDCTNIHITYPALVAGYFFAFRANREAGIVAEEEAAAGTSPRRQLAANDIAIRRGGSPVESILRFHYALSELTGRRGIRDDVSRYESVALTLVEPDGERAGETLDGFPGPDSRILLRNFFSTLYLRYDERYVYGAPDLKPVTRRRLWAPDSPAFVAEGTGRLPARPDGYEARIDGAAEEPFGFAP
ncbi:hypothetical protein [Methylobacterium radiodurans]|uniref:hypothetical protein n=1 Tax=Methylobacterium radiodurans TaxID=2202828 RepID=UPI00194E7F2B|nr:hypothetical protein [Methylobacterium radiodurans]